MIAAEIKRSGLRGKSFELNSEYRAGYIEEPLALVYMVQMEKRSITSEKQLWKCDWELQKTQRFLQVVNGAVMETQHFALRLLDEALSCR